MYSQGRPYENIPEGAKIFLKTFFSKALKVEAGGLEGKTPGAGEAETKGI